MPSDRHLEHAPGASDATRLAGEQHGVLTHAELRACGLSRRQIQQRVREGWLHRVYVGVYAVGHANLTLEGRFLAAVKACGERAVLSHRSAAALFGFIEWQERGIEATAEGSARRHPGLRVHRSAAVERMREFGIPVTSPARTLLDLAATRMSDQALRRAVREAQAQRRIHHRDLQRAVADRRGRRGTARL